MSRLFQQAACVRLQLGGKAEIDFRQIEPQPRMLSEVQIWADVWRRRDPYSALFIADECVYPGGFGSREAAIAAFRRAFPHGTPARGYHAKR